MYIQPWSLDTKTENKISVNVNSNSWQIDQWKEDQTTKRNNFEKFTLDTVVIEITQYAYIIGLIIESLGIHCISIYMFMCKEKILTELNLAKRALSSPNEQIVHSLTIRE